MKTKFWLDQYYIEIFDDSAYFLGSDSPTQYDKIYKSEDSEEFESSSKHAVVIYDGEQEICSAIVLGGNGATTVTENSALLHGSNLIMRCSDTVFSLSIPRLELNWMIVADPITCFSIYQYKDDYITHGEISVTRINKSGKLLWQFGGMDILLRLDGKNCFFMNENSISITDYSGDKYEIDYNGKSFISHNSSISQKTLKDSDFNNDDFAYDKNIQESRAIRKAYDDMVNNCLSGISNKLILKEFPVEDITGFEKFNMVQNLDFCINRVLQSANIQLKVFLVQYSSSFPTAKSSNSSVDEYLFGYMEIKKTHPHVYVQQETFKDKIIDLILKRDVDFKNSKRFSRKFQVFTEDKSKLSELWQLKDLDMLADFSELELEIIGNACLFRNSRKAISQGEAENFAELAKAIIKILG